MLSKEIATKALNVEDTTAVSNGQAHEESFLNLETKKKEEARSTKIGVRGQLCAATNRLRLNLPNALLICFRKNEPEKAIGA